MGTQEGHTIYVIAHAAGLSAASVTPGTRLLQDIRMDGDDAVDFFKTFEKKFNVDLVRLWEHCITISLRRESSRGYRFADSKSRLSSRTL